MKVIKNWTSWIFWFTLAVAVILVYKTVDGFDDIYTLLIRFLYIIRPFLLAVLMAYLFYIPCRTIEALYRKTKILNRAARFLSVITVYIIALWFVVLMLNIILPAISKGVTGFANNLPSYYSRATSFVSEMPEDSIIRKESLENMIDELAKIDVAKFFNMENITDYINGFLRCGKHYIRSAYNSSCINIYVAGKN